MKNILIVSSLISILVLSGCSRSGKPRPGKIDLNDIQKSTLTSEQKAEKMALAGEQLVSPVSFMYADYVFDQALVQDSKNFRAQFYKALLAQVVVYRGIVKRVEPYIKTQSTKVEQNRYDRWIKNQPNSGLKSFLLDNSNLPDIKDEKSFQAFLDTVTAGYETYRTFLKTNKNSMNLTLNVNDSKEISRRVKAGKEECSWKNPEPGIYDPSECVLTDVLEIKVDQADAEVMQQVAAGMEMYHIMLNSYDMSGLINANKVLPENATPAQIFAYLNQIPDFGQLRSEQKLGRVTEMGSDVVAGMKYAMENYKMLCPEGTHTEKARKGHIIENSICMYDVNVPDSKNRVEKLIASMTQILGGGVVLGKVGHDIRDDSIVTANFNYTALLKNPVQDLKKQFPTSFNRCGNPVALADKTMGGLYADGDAEDKLTRTGKLGASCE
ncbi:MAG: hypothetical protein SGJ18_15385 [Pseudomonadota bacterium]|nr:hypothetical protein [Pseudomonadota bacterium]